MRRIRFCLPLLCSIVVLIAACVPASSLSVSSPAPAPTPSALGQDLHVLPVDDPIDTHRLDEAGVAFNPADPARVKPGITREQAIAKAWTDSPKKAGGEVTAAADLGYFGGGTMLSGLTPERLVWFVGFTGPGIVAYSSGPPSAAHVIGHEYVTIVDATSGEVLMGMTCCVIHDQAVLPSESCTQPPGLGPISFSCEAALQRAMEAARQSRPELGIQQARIDSLRAELMTYADADRQLGRQHGHRSTPGQDPNELVWFVQISGSFRFEGMAAAGAAEHPIYEAKECEYLYSAVAGREIEAIVPDTTLAGHTVGPAGPSPNAPTTEPPAADLSAFRLLISADPLAGPAPLKIRLRGTLMGGPDNSRDLYCAPARWDFGDGKKMEWLPDCLAWTPGARIQRSFETEYTYDRAGSYPVHLSIFAGATALTAQVLVTVTASATATAVPR